MALTETQLDTLTHKYYKKVVSTMRRDPKFYLGGYRVHPDDCEHDRKKIFNGHCWRCAESLASNGPQVLEPSEPSTQQHVERAHGIMSDIDLQIQQIAESIG